MQQSGKVCVGRATRWALSMVPACTVRIVGQCNDRRRNSTPIASVQANCRFTLTAMIDANLAKDTKPAGEGFLGSRIWLRPGRVASDVVLFQSGKNMRDALVC